MPLTLYTPRQTALLAWPRVHILPNRYTPKTGPHTTTHPTQTNTHPQTRKNNLCVDYGDDLSAVYQPRVAPAVVDVQGRHPPPPVRELDV
jgi:hypothetical protein